MPQLTQTPELVTRERTSTAVVLLAGRIAARLNCIASGNDEWRQKHTDAIVDLCLEILPSGSGLDSGCTINLDRSTSERIIIDTAYHHMNDGGMYDGWTEHTVSITPAFAGINVSVSGRNRNDIKDYLGDTFQCALTAEVIESYEPATDTLTFRVKR